MTEPEPSAAPPSIMGATGGSGTRVVARIAREAGLYIGNDLNPAEDSLEVAEYFDRWINPYYWHASGAWAEGPEPQMSDELAALVERHRSPAHGGPWGWKEPRSVFLVAYLAQRLPAMRFVHMVRDGRDIAFSKNQNQPRKHASAYLGQELDRPDAPGHSIRLWNAVNLAAADAGEGELGDRYLRVRFEDLCARPAEEIARVLSFLGLEGDAAAFARQVEPPPTIGRWRESEPGLREQLQELARPALERFGYVDG